MNKLVQVLFLMACFSFSSTLSQEIHSIQVQGANGASLQQARDEFWQYHQLATGTWNAFHDNSYIQTYFGYTWPNPMLVWDEYGRDIDSNQRDAYTRANACVLLGYIRAYRCEIDGTRRAAYLSTVQKMTEYLLCLQQQNTDGGILGTPGTSATNSDIQPTSHACVAFCESYCLLHDPRYLNAAILSANWTMNHPTYPYGNLGTSGSCPALPPGHPSEVSPCTYYSNVNHLGLQLWSLASIYGLVGVQAYLDRSIALAEEIIAWQDYIDNTNPWPSGAIPDGGWYWYDYSANPVPTGSPTPPPNGSFDASRLMGYHNFTIRGLLQLLSSIGQQSLPGTTTFRNGNSFAAFREKLVSAVKKATNFMIDNQEVANGYGQYRGGLKYYKNNKSWSGTSFTDNFTTSSGGFESVVNAFRYIYKYSGNLSTTDVSRLESFVKGVSEGYLSHHDGNFTNSGWVEGILPGWGNYLEYLTEGSISPVMTLKNKGFEDDKIIWETWSWDSQGVSVVNNNARSGSKCVRITDNSTNASKWAIQIVSAFPGNLYTLSGFAKIMSGRQFLNLEFLDSSFQSIVTYRSEVSQASNYTYASASSVSPNRTAYVRIWCYAGWYEASDGYWDDIDLQVSDTTPPSKPQNLQVAPYFLNGHVYPLLSWNAMQEPDVRTGGNIVVERRSRKFAAYPWYGYPWTDWSIISTLPGTSTIHVDLQISQVCANCPDSVQYRIRARDIQQNFSLYSDVVGLSAYGVPKVVAFQEAKKPTNFDLSGAFPNPFNPTTTIKYQLAEDGLVSIRVFDILGREVSVVVNGYHDAGYYDATFSAARFPSGPYFARYTVTNTAGRIMFIKSLKLLLIR